MTDYPEDPETSVTPPRSYLPMETNSLAVISFISGLLSWFLLPIIGPVVAIITGHMAKSEIRKHPGVYTGDGLATAGLILGYIQVALGILTICMIALFIIGGISLPVCFGPMSNWQ